MVRTLETNISVIGLSAFACLCSTLFPAKRRIWLLLEETLRGGGRCFASMFATVVGVVLDGCAPHLAMSTYIIVCMMIVSVFDWALGF